MKLNKILITLTLLNFSVLSLSKPETIVDEFERMSVFSPIADEESIPFDRENFSTYQDFFVEGYWSRSEETSELHGGSFPFPISHKKAFSNKEAFIANLEKIQTSEFVKIVAYRGFSHCRFEDKPMNGFKEFELKIGPNTVKWPEGYLHYIEKHNVIPSRKFFRLVMNVSKQLNSVHRIPTCDHGTPDSRDTRDR